MTDQPRDIRTADHWLDEHGDALFSYAVRRLHRRDAAEDLVQDTLLAALQSARRIDDDRAIRGWLMGILKHKLIDHFRRESVRRSDSLSDVSVEPFNADGYWNRPPTDWFDDPSRRAQASELSRQTRDCQSRLPPTLQAAYVLRDIDQEDVDSVCHQLSISANHLAVRLYRARLLLRECIESYLKASRP
jgi:RNA polymerase sigma factor (sigma-70 family)